jgi:acetolactate synthase-1/2/3 large subunit
MLEQLEAQGIDAVFGIPGGNIAAFQQGLRAHSKLRFIITSHEGGAAYMADGYARATGKLGVCLVTSGPGVMNALTGIASAHLDEVPLLVISGQVATDRFGLSAIQESTSACGVDTAALLHHATALSTSVVDPQSFPRLLTKALRTAMGHPKAAVHLSIPSNVSRQTIARTPVPPSHEKLETRAPAARMDDIRALLVGLLSGKRPLILLGSGAREALGQFEREFSIFIQRHRIPVVTSLRGKGIYSERDPWCLGVVGTAADPRAEAYLRAVASTNISNRSGGSFRSISIRHPSASFFLSIFRSSAMPPR